jgi:hypothetical protein
LYISVMFVYKHTYINICIYLCTERGEKKGKKKEREGREWE